MKNRHATGRVVTPNVADERRVVNALSQAAFNTKLTVLRSAEWGFYPYGLSAVILLAESHATVHTYPEFGFAFVDCFTCGEQDPSDLLRSFAEILDGEIEALEVLQR